MFASYLDTSHMPSRKILENELSTVSDATDVASDAGS